MKELLDCTHSCRMYQMMVAVLPELRALHIADAGYIFSSNASVSRVSGPV